MKITGATATWSNEKNLVLLDSENKLIAIIMGRCSQELGNVKSYTISQCVGDVVEFSVITYDGREIEVPSPRIIVER